jgi:hypothetical protein
VASKNYIIRQAAILLKYAKTIKDPDVSAALIDKAADIKDRDDLDRRPQVPDVEVLSPISQSAPLREPRAV